MENLNYSILIPMLGNIIMISFPIALVLMIVKELVNIFTSFVFGRKVDL